MIQIKLMSSVSGTFSFLVSATQRQKQYCWYPRWHIRYKVAVFKPNEIGVIGFFFPIWPSFEECSKFQQIRISFESFSVFDVICLSNAYCCCCLYFAKIGLVHLPEQPRRRRQRTRTTNISYWIFKIQAI